MAAVGRDKLQVGSNTHPHALQENLFWDLGHADHSCRMAHTSCILGRPEDTDTAVFVSVCFELQIRCNELVAYHGNATRTYTFEDLHSAVFSLEAFKIRRRPDARIDHS